MLVKGSQEKTMVDDVVSAYVSKKKTTKDLLPKF